MKKEKKARFFEKEDYYFECVERGRWWDAMVVLEWRGCEDSFVQKRGRFSSLFLVKVLECNGHGECSDDGRSDRRRGSESVSGAAAFFGAVLDFCANLTRFVFQ